MILSLNVKNIFIFAVIVGGVLATNNIRELKESSNYDDSSNSDTETAVVTEAAEVVATPSYAYQGPSITLDKEIYDEGEDITVSFSVGRPNDKYYSSTDAPSLNLDFNYPKWRIGLFMRDADPQGGSLEPIVGINLCGAMNCDPNNLNFQDYTSSVTFGFEYESLMDGRWPVKMNDYGSGLDAYVVRSCSLRVLLTENLNTFHTNISLFISYLLTSQLDANGAGAIGPFEFEIHSNEKPKPKKKLSGLSKYNHAHKKDTGRKRNGINKAALTGAKLHDTNGLVTNLPVSNGKDTKSGSSINKSAEKNTISAEKKEYQENEQVSISYSLDDIFKNEDKSKWRIGFFPSNTLPHGGDIDPIVSISLCGEKECPNTVGTLDGRVTFGREAAEAIEGDWPIDFNEWGNKLNVFVLDDSGATILGPETISILANELA